MKKSASLAAMYAAMGMLGASTFGRKDSEVFADPLNPVVTLPAQKKPPTGAKEYFFNEDGEFSSDHMRKTECVFTCYAINDRNAMRKFYNWNNGKNSLRS